MTLTIDGEWESKGRPPKWLGWFGRMFYWTKRGKFGDSAVIDGEGIFYAFRTPIGLIAAVYVNGAVRILVDGRTEWQWKAPIGTTAISFEPLPGQRVKGTATVS
jgi:hypothetical protein